MNRVMKPRFRRGFAIGAVCATVAVGIPAVALAIRGANAPSAPATANQPIGLVTSAEKSAVDPRTAATLGMLNDRGHAAAAVGKRLVNDARTLPMTISGKRLYLVPTGKGKLCLFLEGSGETCSDRLSQANPALIVAEDDDGPGGVGPTVYGVAMDGVRSVTIAIGGERHVIPVTANAFVFRGDSAATAASLLAMSAARDDGTTLSLR